MNQHNTLIWISLVLVIFISGCIPQKRIEDLGIITVRGTDLKNKNKVHSTFVIFEFNSEKTSGKIVSGEATTLRGSQLNANMESNFELATAKVQLELYGIEVAKKGLKPYLDLLYRDANLPDTMYIALGKTTAFDVLSLQEIKGMSIDIGRFLRGVIDESTAKEIFPKVRLADMLTTLNDTGKDVILPVFENIEDLPKITAIAVFRNDKYVGSLPMDNKILFNLFQKNLNEEIIEISVPIEPFKDHLKDEKSDDKTIYTALSILKGKAKVKLVDKDTLTFRVETNLDLSLIELSEHINLTEPKVVKLLEEEYEKKLVSKYEKLLKDLKEFNSDPIGFGAVYRTQYKEGILTDEKWRELFPNIKVEFKVKVTIKNHGEHY